MPDFTTRYVALGDSFTEGVGDVDPARPNGVRGWADRLALLLAQESMSDDGGTAAAGDAAASSAVGYANLAIRGRKMRGILAEQIEPALALKPTLVTLYAGANDILRPRIDVDALLAEYRRAVARLRDSGAEVLLFTGFDARSSKVFGTMRGRTAVYNELVRGIAEDLGARVVDYWRFDEYHDWRFWGEDRMHMSALGHGNMAERVFHRLTGRQVPSATAGRFQAPELPALPPVPRLDQLKANAEWTRAEALPWIKRRLTGTSSGDGLSPRYPQLVDAATLG
ncbi:MULTISPECIES: SGNH/GDSL hydrolase family protein [Arthrobacter]|uniref:SGNH/GDSL hydrolase family protein n=2 Tax=Arthrobacter TaxID=1663 RepID=A0ABU9KJM0_9MICC|nr:SGNH/GDSL hydrolase family protein [Arthrobacter sp. YJM1]MDP5226769.1 SGNH/GDSL hydrolase family protein [Arthrobacter sp. YJM1]